MSRSYNNSTVNILKTIDQKGAVNTGELYETLGKKQSYKDFYNTIFRLTRQGLIDKKDTGQGLLLSVTAEGFKLIRQMCPEKDGIWKMVIFDIPEKQKYVRVVLRSKLKALRFKKWQNSIWVSPFKLDEEIETELNQLAKKFFIRLIKTKDINYTEDLEKMFTD